MRTYGPVPVGTEAWSEVFVTGRAAVSSGNLNPCPDCGHSVSRLAEACPSCGRVLRTPVPREGLFLRTLNQLVGASFWTLALLILVPLLAALVGVLMTRWWGS
jgi:hypothetical protein